MESQKIDNPRPVQRATADANTLRELKPLATLAAEVPLNASTSALSLELNIRTPALYEILNDGPPAVPLENRGYSPKSSGAEFSVLGREGMNAEAMPEVMTLMASIRKTRLSSG
jgi:hypothetical protein